MVEAAVDGLAFYFAHLGCPWERGSNENTNGSLREAFPKYSDFSPVTDEAVQNFVDKKYELAAKEREIKRLEMENELMRNFLLLTGRK